MWRKVVFLVLFVPLHFITTLFWIHHFWINYSPERAGVGARIAHVVVGIVAAPLFALFRTMGLQEDSPMLLQLSLLAAYSLLWGLAILLVYVGIKRALRRKKPASDVEPAAK